MRDKVTQRRAALTVAIIALQQAHDGGSALILDALEAFDLDDDQDEAIKVCLEDLEDELRGKLHRLESRFVKGS